MIKLNREVDPEISKDYCNRDETTLIFHVHAIHKICVDKQLVSYGEDAPFIEDLVRILEWIFIWAHSNEIHQIELC